FSFGATESKWPHELRVDQPRLNLLKAQTITGLMGSSGINGLVVLTPPVNKARYNYDEIIFFNDVSQQLAIATERSQAIGTLQRRVQELDVLSRVGQAVNFTIELDDLLELIFNQTSRLVPVPNFYIVLYEENINRLYFAFFLEGDDRIDAKEGMRWILGNDLFSEVIKTNTSMLVSDFTEEMTSRGAELDLLDEGLTAWMGVPLAGGRGTLGVMAAGKRLDKTEYTAEQFKIFSDVAALAATSLDKANLFNQTRIRQKQLSVLNDISRQLVATETDVEKLLEIITTSAVDILNSEAGSLFLVADDDSGDLVFRVVIGGGGQDLIGQRIASGKGVVGKVVEISEPIIVNDAEADPRHNEEVAENFISRSLLAVPLTAKDEVIGVLQVLNKLDGTPFIEDDSNLLTAFASQAAVAIENARLFQQTDQQLAQRVKELETLERLDAQLNRTLELSEVAQITVKQAMDILSADAGALGIVHENPPYLEIVSIEGYSRDEYPADATGDDGRIWSLESGVVKRVMRTRQADITMDVKMDPDYDHGLTNSNSQITLPMISGNAINAILILEKNSLPRFSLPDWALAQRIAEHASVALANAQLFAEVTRQKNSKSEFMGFAAHELKNPLTSVRGYADALLGGMVGAVSDQQKMFLNTIKSNAERMQVLIDDLRDSAKLDNDEFIVDPEPMNVRSAVVETLRPFVNMLAEKNQDLINSVPENLPLIWGDENRIIQVLTNLVSNAHKYSHENTTIEVGGE
ncbi:MAG: GAF domain-containing sensor histidine kinase, partial [Chloroflexota bacterium]